MGVILRISTLLFLACILSLHSIGQEYPTVSQNGKTYYVYTVEPGNTAYAISKQFSVSITDLIQSNPEIKDGLSIGQEVLIPIDAIDKKQAKKEELNLEGAYIIHTVQKKETLFSIAKKYKVDLNTLSELNPEAATSLRTGSQIRIPSTEVADVQPELIKPADSDSLLIHEVNDGETIYSISQVYGVSVDSILQVNTVDVSDISIGQWIVIPKSKFESDHSEIENSDISKRVYSGTIKQVYDIGLMLPFELSMNDSIEGQIEKGNDLYILTELALEYYRGARLALDTLKKMGLNCNLHVYDVGEDLVNAKETLRKDEIKGLDLIFGPMHKASLAVVSELSVKEGIYLVSPNSFANEVFEDNDHLFRATASRETMLRYLATYISVQHQDHNVIMVSNEGPREWTYRKQFIENYNKALGTFPNSYADSLRLITLDKIKDDELTTWLREDTTNVLVVPSNDLAFVSDFMTRLSRIDEEKYKIQVYGLDRWIKYDNIESEYKNRFKLRLVVPQHIDYSEKDIQVFLEKFYEAYGMEPSGYAYGFLGYDLMFFFGKELIQNGTLFANNIEKVEMDGLGMNYRFAPSTTGKEFENKSVFIIEYEDYGIKRIN